MRIKTKEQYNKILQKRLAAPSKIATQKCSPKTRWLSKVKNMK
uniref:Uncharacterized protein n=1 Tax=viral metagenome TaxID=1070528 RepID=A0A6M3LM79_9ZZZZ